MKKLSAILMVLAVVAASAIAAPKEIVFMDSQSGANFQQWWQTIALPAAEEFLGVKIKYVVGSDAEIIERMKAWKAGQGDITVLFPKSTALFVKTPQVQLETLTTARIPNIAKIDPLLQASTEGVPVAGKGAAYWFTTYALIYNSAYVKNPPKSWQEFYDRRAEWKGHIGFIRPDAKSSGGWRQPFAFLNAFCDFSKKFDPNAADFQAAWAKLQDFYTYCQLPLASEPTNAFENFNAGDTWITVYAMDYSLWSARQGTMPPTTKAMFLEPGIDAGGQAYLVVPANIPEENKQIAYKLINYLLSDDHQVRMVSTMWQYNSTMINDKVPGIVWEQIPKLEVARKAIIPADRVNADAITYIKKNAVGIIPK